METNADVEIVWRAFELRPEPVPTLDPDGEYLRTIWQSSVYPLAERLGMEMRLPPVQPRSRSAHEAAKWAAAAANGRFEDYNAALFRAFFEHGDDIGRTETLVRIAFDLGLEGADLRRSLEEREHLEAVLADERAAAELGVNGVPAFIAERRAALTGVRTAEALEQLVTSVREMAPGRNI